MHLRKLSKWLTLAVVITILSVILIRLCVFYSREDFSKKIYWDAAHTIAKSIESYDSAGLQDGESREWFRNGTLAMQSQFRHGSPVSIKEWYPTGKLRLEEHFREGLADGWQRWWGPDGHPLKRVYFTMGTGVDYYFDENGKEKGRAFYISGQKINGDNH